MQEHQLSSRWRAVVLLTVGLFVGAIALFALAACGGDGEDPASAAPTQAPAESTATTTPAEPTTTPMPEPPAAPMVPATVPESGSDEEQVLAVLETQVRAINTADYVLFQETCTPSAKKIPTVAQLKYVFEELGGRTDGEMFSYRGFSPQGYNVRNVEVKLLRAPFAQTIFDIYDYDRLVTGRMREGGQYGGPVSRTFEKVEGQWYSEAAPCGRG